MQICILIMFEQDKSLINAIVCDLDKKPINGTTTHGVMRELNLIRKQKRVRTVAGIQIGYKQGVYFNTVYVWWYK